MHDLYVWLYILTDIDKLPRVVDAILASLVD